MVIPSLRSASTVVGILLCTFNGERYLREQLDSFMAQTHEDWRLFVSDDGSTDSTLGILEAYQRVLGDRLTVMQGPRKGFGQNFLSLIRNTAVTADTYAFSDQDDIWLPNKLERSIASLARLRTRGPQLYCSRTRLIDNDGAVTGQTPLFSKRPSFRNALVQSLAGANTMLINEAARQLLSRTPEDVSVVAHDWLAYILVTGCGGEVVYDPIPSVLYRQHAGNLIGANSGLRSRFNRVSKMLGGRFKLWNEKNLRILNSYQTDLTLENRLTLGYFIQMREAGVFRRLRALRCTGFYRQTLAGTVSLYVAVALHQV